MKRIKLVVGALCLASLVCLTACDDDNNNGGSNNTAQSPAGFGGTTMNVNVTGGTGGFTNAGTFVLTTDGARADTTGNFGIVGDGGVGNSSGTYTYNKTGTNTANLVLTDSTSGSVVNSVLTFDTANTGSMQSDDGAGSTQSGTFTTQ